MKPLLALPTEVLLDKFGSGGHSPGSGSAAALIGLLAARLVDTVGQLTLARSAYSDHHGDVQAICTRIQSTLVPKLTDMFQRDAEVFDLVIKARNARNDATDEILKKKLAAAALEQLKLATAIPFGIAEACLELIDLSAKVFDVGFKGARGDTGVALSAAVAGVLSAVFVINLNLKSFEGNFWARQRRRECDLLQKTAVEKYHAALARVDQLRSEDVDAFEQGESSNLIGALWASSKSSYTGPEIEERAAAVRALVWKKRADLWADTAVPTDPVDLLEPQVALRLLGFKCSLVETLGTASSKSGLFEVAGLLEAQSGQVSVSRQMSKDVRLFTAAHELGHVVLHPHLKEAHRDRPLDGTVLARSPMEREADKFASSFLMPANLVRTRFSSIFGTLKFSLSDETSFALLGIGLSEARKRMRNTRTLSLTLASTERFNGRQITSLTNQFKVSPTAMAIRLEELGLLVI